MADRAIDLYPILRRAAALFVACIAIVVASIGGLAWYQLRIANPCPADGTVDGNAVTCYHRLTFTGLDEWPWLAAALVAGFGVCIAVSWLSLRRRSSSSWADAGPGAHR